MLPFFFYNILPEEFGDDEEESIAYNMLVNVWGLDKDTVLDAEKNAKRHLKDNDFIWVDCNPDYDVEIVLYHNSNRFSCSVDV